LIEVIDNFLNETELRHVNKMLEPDFPWFFNNGSDNPNDGAPQFVHVFLIPPFQKASDYYTTIFPILGKMKIYCPIGIKANMTMHGTKDGAFHIDNGSVVQHLHPAMGDVMRTAIYYFHEIGGTEFEGGEIVKAVPNRFVSFPSKIPHRALKKAEEGQRRVVLNVNYIPGNFEE
jgi:hypothetical protein